MDFQIDGTFGGEFRMNFGMYLEWVFEVVLVWSFLGDMSSKNPPQIHPQFTIFTAVVTLILTAKSPRRHRALETLAQVQDLKQNAVSRKQLVASRRRAVASERKHEKGSCGTCCQMAC